MYGEHAGAPVEPRKLRIALLGPYHSPNLGDTAIQMSVIQNLLARRPRLEIVGVSLDARDSARSLGVPAFPLSGLGAVALRPELCAGYRQPSSRWPAFLPPQLKPAARLVRRLLRIALQPAALARIGRFLGSIDILIVSGGGQLDDFYGGAWAHPYLLQLWVALARLRGVRVAVVGVGLDRLQSRLSRIFVLNALKLAQYRSFRDTGTLALLRAIGWRGESRVCPDLAFSLTVPPAMVTPTDGAYVVISPISEQTWSSGNDPRHRAYLDGLAAAAVRLHERAMRIRIVCSQFVMDAKTAAGFAAMLRERGVVNVEMREAPTVAQFLGQVRDASVVVASRLHAVILSLVAGAPVVAVAPLRKVSQVMQDAGLAEYCVELQDFCADALTSCIVRAIERQADLRAQIQDYAQRSRSALSRTFDDINQLIEEIRQ